mmetsp:Transcript_15444/g.22814  ORF Transcript_15444/g.22814 Transcript_15444/m.22814 type:complete len:117 (+) Transcript_15444:1024-1374(+)
MQGISAEPMLDEIWWRTERSVHTEIAIYCDHNFFSHVSKVKVEVWVLSFPFSRKVISKRQIITFFFTGARRTIDKTSKVSAYLCTISNGIDFHVHTLQSRNLHFACATVTVPSETS